MSVENCVQRLGGPHTKRAFNAAFFQDASERNFHDAFGFRQREGRNHRDGAEQIRELDVGIADLVKKVEWIFRLARTGGFGVGVEDESDVGRGDQLRPCRYRSASEDC